MKQIPLVRCGDCTSDFTSNGVRVRVIYKNSEQDAGYRSVPFIIGDIKIYATVYFDAPLDSTFSEKEKYPACIHFDMYSDGFKSKREWSLFRITKTSVEDARKLINTTVQNKLPKILAKRQEIVAKVAQSNKEIAKFLHT